MTHEEIKQKIDSNNAKIESMLSPAHFVLNAEIAELLKENEELQAQCEHEYENGQCIYCYKQED